MIDSKLQEKALRILELDTFKYKTLIEAFKNNVIEKCEVYNKIVIFKYYETDWYQVISEDDEELKELIPQLRSYNHFGETATRLVEILSKDKTLSWQADCYKVVYNKSTKVESGKYKSLPLREKDAEIINELWPYNHETSLELIRNMIKENKTLGIFKIDENGKPYPISWVLASKDNSMGFFHTLKEYRRGGYGESITKDLVNLIIEDNGVPSVFIKIENEKSLPLVLKLGFDIVDYVSWFEFEK